MSEKQQGLYVFKDGEWQEISSKSEAGVKSVNDKIPDENGNIDLGDLLTSEELEGKSEKVLEEAKEYTDEISSGVKSDAFKYTDAEIARINSNSLGLPNIIKSTEEPEQPPSSDWDIWVQYEKPEGYVTLGELPVGAKINAGLNFEDKNHMLEIASQNAYEQNETLLLLSGVETYLLYSALEEEWEDTTITRRDYQQWSIHQWLNSRNKDWFSPTTSWQKNPPEDLKYKHGFLSYFPLAIQRYMKTISIPYTLFPEIGTSETSNKKTFEKLNAIAFLPSAKESGKKNKRDRVLGYDSEEHVLIEGLKNKRHQGRTATRSISDIYNGQIVLLDEHGIFPYTYDIYNKSNVIDPLISFSMDTPVYKVENEEEGESYYAIGGTQQFATPVKQMWVNILK